MGLQSNAGFSGVIQGSMTASLEAVGSQRDRLDVMGISQLSRKINLEAVRVTRVNEGKYQSH